MHRAFFFNEESASEEDMKVLKEINKDIRKQMEASLNIDKFEEVSGITIDEFFNGENVIDVNLNAKNAKKIGLIKKITNMIKTQSKELLLLMKLDFKNNF